MEIRVPVIEKFSSARTVCVPVIRLGRHIAVSEQIVLAAIGSGTLLTP